MKCRNSDLHIENALKIGLLMLWKSACSPCYETSNSSNWCSLWSKSLFHEARRSKIDSAAATRMSDYQYEHGVGACTNNKKEDNEQANLSLCCGIAASICGRWSHIHSQRRIKYWWMKLGGLTWKTNTSSPRHQIRPWNWSRSRWMWMQWRKPMIFTKKHKTRQRCMHSV